MNARHTMKRVLFLSILLFSLFATGLTFTGVARTLYSTAPAVAAQGKADVKVWVNTASGVYHCPGTRWYGNTKQGEYMTQKQAQDKKYRPAYGKYCD